VETGRVSVNTPEMRVLFNEVRDIPVSDWVNFLPDRLDARFLSWFPAVCPSFTAFPRYMSRDMRFLFHSMGGLWTPTFFYNYVYLLQGQSNMLWGAPVLRATDDGYINFRALSGFSIMRQSNNQDLSWEFLRFMMEYRNSVHALLDGPERGWTSWRESYSFPLNRIRFEHQLSQVMLDSNNVNVNMFQFIHMTDSYFRQEAVPNAVNSFRGLVEAVNREDRRDWATVNSIVYPEVFLFWEGRQDVYRTLANIQNRLELFVSE